MKCAICGRPCREALLRLGPYCCDEHRRQLVQRHRRLLDELRREDLRALPDLLTPPEFERLALKFAVHLLAVMTPRLRQSYRAHVPALLDPLVMAQELKARILRHLPASHVRLTEARGLLSFFYDGTYTLLQPIPAPLMRAALVKARLLPGQG
jgi:hypothetical protein